MELGAIDIATIVGILLLNVIVGVAWSKQASQGTEDYYLAGRSLPWWLLGTSMVATTFALDTPLVIAEYIVNGGLYVNWLWISLALSHVFVAMLLASKWRRSGAMTDVELCEMRYSGRPAQFLRIFKSLFLAVVMNCLNLAVVFFAVRKICHGFGFEQTTILGFAFADVVLLAGLFLTLCYSASAGLYGVVTTDAFQFSLALTGAVLVAVLGLYHPKVGGISGLRRGLEKIASERAEQAAKLDPEALKTAKLEDPLSLAPKGLGSAKPGTERMALGSLRFDDKGLTLLVFFWIMWWAWKYSDGGGILVQRMLAAKDEKHAVYGTLWFCLCHYVLRWWPWAIAALCALLIFEGQKLEGSQAYAQLVKEIVPLGLRGLILAYFLAAFMSTVDTHIQLASSYVVNDCYKRFIKPDADPKHYVFVGRVCIVLVLVLAYLSSHIYSSFKQIYLFILNLVAGAGVVFLLRWFWWRINAWTEISALFASLFIGGGFFLYNSGLEPAERVPSWMITCVNVFSSGAIWLTVTFLTEPEQPKVLQNFYDKVQPWGFWSELRAHSKKPGPAMPWTALLCWLVTVFGLFLSLFAVRALFFGSLILGALGLALGLVIAVWVVRQVPRIVDAGL